jgi:isoleucyl-tRNA synthetase
MLILSVALFGKSSYKNVVVNGTILAEDGKKMSKSENNYPDPKFLFEKYGADATRFYMLSSSAVRAESMQFSEKGVDEIMKKVVIKTKNILAFYELYKDTILEDKKASNSKNILDK